MVSCAVLARFLFPAPYTVIPVVIEATRSMYNYVGLPK